MELDSRGKPPERSLIGHWALIFILGASFLAEGLVLNEKNHQLKDYEVALKEDVKQIGDLIQAHSKCELDLLLYKSIVEEIQKRKEAQAQTPKEKKPLSSRDQDSIFRQLRAMEKDMEESLKSEMKHIEEMEEIDYGPAL